MDKEKVKNGQLPERGMSEIRNLKIQIYFYFLKKQSFH